MEQRSAAQESTTRSGRARSRTIASIFASEVQGGKGGAAGGRARGFSLASTSARPRTDSVTSGGKGVPVDVALPEREVGLVARSLRDEGDDFVPELNQQGRVEQDHLAEQGEHHHDSVVDHLDVM